MNAIVAQRTDFFTSFLIFFFIIAGCVNSAADSKTVVLEYPQEDQNVTDVVTTTATSDTDVVTTTATSDTKHEERATECIKGIHLTAWASGSERSRKIAMDLFENTELNTAVIDIKESEGYVYIDGIKIVNAARAYVAVIPDIGKYISYLKSKGIYTIARIVVFGDDIMARKNPDLAIKNPDGTVWTDRKNLAWLDPYNKDAWDYNLQIAQRAATIGFDEIQFDYIRFPTDGNTKNCRYSKPHCAAEASKALVGFLKEANKRLKAKDVKISIDVFGLTTTARDDMGIGQKIVEMTEWVDYVSPMVYPSHYKSGNYGIAEPNKEPYKIVYYAMEDALKRIPKRKLRPWLQDFSLGGYKYDKNAVRAQMQACYDNKVCNWLLWNPKAVYTREALKGQDEKNYHQESNPPTIEMLKTTNKKSPAVQTTK